MKLEERYVKLKGKYPNYVIFMKNGNFYNTYFDDAILVSLLCNYKMIGNRIGFPLSSLEKVTNRLIYTKYKPLIVGLSFLETV